MIVCNCHAQSETDIERHIDNGASSVTEIGMRTGAGTSCGCCREQIHDLIERARGCRGCPDCPFDREAAA